jgi:hypothetical protein
LLAFAMLAGPAAAEFTPVVSLLFEDNFSYSGGVSTDLNVNINSASRVSGLLAGQVSYDTANMAGLKDIDGDNQKMDLSDGGAGTSSACVGLTKNFNNDLAIGGLTVLATVNPRGDVVTISDGNNSSSPADIGDTYLDGANNYIGIQAVSSGSYASVKDLRVYNNAVATPEPGTLALLAGAAGFAFVWFRRR